MNCDKTQQCMLYLWGEMTADDSQTFAQHLNQCPACKAEVEQLEPLVRSMQAIELEQLPEGLAERVRTRLDRSPAHPRRLRITPRRGLAVAASILLLLGLSTMWRLMFNGTQPPISPVAQTLTEDDYVEALALVWISEPQQSDSTSTTSDDTLATELEDIAVGIESLLQEVEYELSPDASGSGTNDTQGSRLPTFGRAATT